MFVGPDGFFVMSIISAAHTVASTIFSNFFVHLPYSDGSFHKQIVIVTGSNTGLGFEASRHLVRLGVEKLIIGVRSVEKRERARRDIFFIRKSGWVFHWSMTTRYEQLQFRQGICVAFLKSSYLDAILTRAGVFTRIFSVTKDNGKLWQQMWLALSCYLSSYFRSCVNLQSN